MAITYLVSTSSITEFMNCTIILASYAHSCKQQCFVQKNKNKLSILANTNNMRVLTVQSLLDYPS